MKMKKHGYRKVEIYLTMYFLSRLSFENIVQDISNDYKL